MGGYRTDILRDVDETVTRLRKAVSRLRAARGMAEEAKEALRHEELARETACASASMNAESEGYAAGSNEGAVAEADRQVDAGRDELARAEAEVLKAEAELRRVLDIAQQLLDEVCERGAGSERGSDVLLSGTRRFGKRVARPDYERAADEMDREVEKFARAEADLREAIGAAQSTERESSGGGSLLGGVSPVRPIIFGGGGSSILNASAASREPTWLPKPAACFPTMVTVPSITPRAVANAIPGSSLTSLAVTRVSDAARAGGLPSVDSWGWMDRPLSRADEGALVAGLGSGGGELVSRAKWARIGTAAWDTITPGVTTLPPLMPGPGLISLPTPPRLGTTMPIPPAPVLGSSWVEPRLGSSLGPSPGPGIASCGMTMGGGPAGFGPPNLGFPSLGSAGPPPMMVGGFGGPSMGPLGGGFAAMGS